MSSGLHCSKESDTCRATGCRTDSARIQAQEGLKVGSIYTHSFFSYVNVYSVENEQRGKQKQEQSGIGETESKADATFKKMKSEAGKGVNTPE